MVDYKRNDRKIEYLSRQNTKLSNIVLKELESGNANFELIDNCFAAIKINQSSIWKLIKQNTIRIKRVKSRI